MTSGALNPVSKMQGHLPTNHNKLFSMLLQGGMQNAQSPTSGSFEIDTKISLTDSGISQFNQVVIANFEESSTIAIALGGYGRCELHFLCRLTPFFHRHGQTN